MTIRAEEAMTPLPRYVYLAVACSACGWTGKRGNRVRWPACPSCHGVDTVRFTDKDSLRATQRRPADRPLISKHVSAHETKRKKENVS